MKKHLNTLYITTEGIHLSLEGETVVAGLHGQKLMRLPLQNIEAIQSFGWNISASPQLMGKCAQQGIHMAFCTPSGKLMCCITGPAHGNVLLRRSQYRLADDPFASLRIAREMVAAKILNTRTNLQRAARDNAELVPALLPSVRSMARGVRHARHQQSARALLGVEGYAADVYFSAFSALIKSTDFTFGTRNRRPPRDPVNALLSFAYVLLAADCKSALEAVGLDSAVGIYHRDRPGRPGLALDLMEEFRGPLADRLALTLINRKQINATDFDTDEGGGMRLSDAARKTVLTHWQERKAEVIVHPYLQEKMTIGLLPHIQARLLANHIRGALDAYPPLIWK